MIEFEVDCTYTAKLNNQSVNATCIDILYNSKGELSAIFEINDNPYLVYWGKVKRCRRNGSYQETIANEELSVYSGD